MSKKNSEYLINRKDNQYEVVIGLEVHAQVLSESKLNIKHYKIGDVGLSKSFNFGVSKAKNENILITQPDVQFEKNSILKLIKAQKKYPKAGIIAPLLFEKKNTVYMTI